MNNGALHSAANSSGPSIGASSLVTDANSALSGGGPQLQRSASINNESYMRLPASPMSFSSNNISGSSMMDGSSLVQQSPQHAQMQRGASSITSPSVTQETGNSMHAQKKAWLDMRQDDVLKQQVIQQLLQRQESLQLQGHHNPQLHAIIQEQRLAQRQQQQHQILQSLPHMQRMPVNPQIPQMRPSQLQMHVGPPVRRPSDSGLCARRLMQYMYHQRHRPPDNSILYWRKFVAEYFTPRAKKRWCLSLYDNVGSHALGAFPQAAMDAWQCDICGSRSGKGFEATYEVLPRLSQIKFDRGVIDELLFLDMPREFRLASGMMVLEYAKAVQESVYEQLRVVREGQLRITFTPDLKILCWEFCARRHEEFLPRRTVAPQVNQLLQVAQKYQNTVNDSGSAGLSPQDLQASCNMFMTAGRQLARSLELQSLNDLGFSKRYVRCLQISEVVNSMKDLIDFGRDNKIGPIESLKNYPRQASAKLQAQKIQEVEQMVGGQGLPADQNTLNKIMAMHPGLSSHTSNNHVGTRIVNNNTAQSAAAMNNYHYLLRTSSNLSQNPLQPSSFGSPKAQSVPLQSSVSSYLTNPPPVNVAPASNQHQPSSDSSLPQQSINPQSSQMNQHLEQHVIQQLLQDMMNNNNRVPPQQSHTALNGNVAAEEAIGAGGSSGEGMPARLSAGSARNDVGQGNSTSNVSGGTGMAPSRSNSFKSAANNNSSGSSNSFNARSDGLQNLQLPELDQDILQEFAENGIQW